MHNIHKSTHTQARIHALSLCPTHSSAAAALSTAATHTSKVSLSFCTAFCMRSRKTDAKTIKRKTSEVCVRMYVSMCVHICACECVFNTCYNSNCHKKKPFSKGAGRREAFSMYCAHTELVKCMCVCVRSRESI